MILFFLLLFVYFYAGYVISGITIEYLEEKEPTYFFNFHKSLNVPWSIKTTKLICLVVFSIFWMPSMLVKECNS